MAKCDVCYHADGTHGPFCPNRGDWPPRVLEPNMSVPGSAAKIRRTLLPFERRNLHAGLTVCSTEVSRVKFRPLHLIIFSPDPYLYVCEITVLSSKRRVFAAAGELPSSAFAQSQPIKLPLDMDSIHFGGERVQLEVDNKGLKLLMLEAALEGLIAE